jgi:hypothetical protein
LAIIKPIEMSQKTLGQCRVTAANGYSSEVFAAEAPPI